MDKGLLDAALRKVIDPPLDVAARQLVSLGITANQVTWTGFVIGLLAVPALAFEQNLLAGLCVALNRIADGLDGAVARQTEPTDVGGFLDIVLDFIFYSSVPFGMALASPSENGLAASFLIFSFIGTGSSFLAYATIAAKRGIKTDKRGPKVLYYLGGLTEGTETIIVLLAICVVPSAFVVLAFVFGVLCWITTATRILHGMHDFRGEQP